MSGLIFEALMDYVTSDECHAMDKDVGTPDLEQLANFIAANIVAKGFWMEG